MQNLLNISHKNSDNSALYAERAARLVCNASVIDSLDIGGFFEPYRTEISQVLARLGRTLPNSEMSDINTLYDRFMTLADIYIEN